MKTSLKNTLNSKSIVRVAGAFDAMSAKLVETSGFDAIWAGSFAISATHALPDASILTMTEFLHVSTNMAESCQIPIIADCDTGYGGPSNVAHMIKKYEKAGVAAVSIEDKIFPKQNSLLKDGKQDLISEKDFVAKLIAAKNAKESEDFMIIARIESLIAKQGLEDALHRASAYEKAGADAILIHSKNKTPNEIFQFCDQYQGNIPLVVIPTSYPNVTLDELKSHNIKMIIYANQTLRVAHQAMKNLLSQISNHDNLANVSNKISSMEEIFELQEMYDLKNQEKSIENDLKKLGYI
jgi:phosphoenolpyruvate phosphomutase